MSTQTFPDDRGERFEIAFTWIGYCFGVLGAMGAAAGDQSAALTCVLAGAACIGAVFVAREEALPRIGRYGMTTLKIVGVVVGLVIAIRTANGL